MAGIERDLSRIPRPISSSNPGPISGFKAGRPKLSRGRFSEKVESNRSRTAERMDSQVSNTVEGKNFRVQLNRYCKELDDLSSAQHRLQNKKEDLNKIRADYQAKFKKDLGEVPGVPLFGESVLIEEIQKIKSENSSLKKHLEDVKKQMKSADHLIKMEAEMPKIENSMAVMMEIISNAENKQNFIEKNLETVKNEIDSILNSLRQIASGGESGNELALENSRLKEDQNQLSNEVALKDRQIVDLKELVEKEQNERVSLQKSLIGINTENIRLQENCRKLTEEVESLKQNVQADVNSENGIQNEKLHSKCEMEIAEFQSLLKQSKLENVKLSQKLHNKVKEHDELMSDFLESYNECLFDKEHHIYNIKCQMDEIIQLKNLVEGDGTMKYDLEVVMALEDCKSLKNEVLRYHKRWVETKESENKIQGLLAIKDAKINNLAEELHICNRSIKSLESLISSLKERDKRNCLNMKNLQNSLSMKMGDSTPSNENVGHIMQFAERNDGKNTVSHMFKLVSTLEQYKATMSCMERKLSDLESVHCLCAERRTRNEQRIALLEIDLAKYE